MDPSATEPIAEAVEPAAGEPLLTPEAPEFYFWLRHARRSQEPIVVLDAGAGRLAIPLAEQTLNVIAVEPSDSRRRRGAARAAEIGVELQWEAGQPATFRPARQVGMVALGGRRFQTLLSQQAQKEALRNIHDALQIGGKLALDLAVPDVTAMAARETTLRRLDPLVDPESGHTIYRWVSSRYDLDDHCFASHLIYEMVDGEGTTIRRWHRHVDLAYLWPREMELLLEVTGFEVEALFGGWQDEPFSSESARQVWVARKAIT